MKESKIERGIFRGQGYELPEGTEILFKRIGDNVVIYDKDTKKALYILSNSCIEPIKEVKE